MDEKDKKILEYTNNYISLFIDKPVEELIENDPITNAKYPSMLSLLRKIKEEIFLSKESINELFLNHKIKTVGKDHLLKIGNDFFENDNYDNEFKEIVDQSLLKKHIILYLDRELNWIIISLLSASYISANILMRSIFELLINWATNINDTMGNKIDAINYLDDDDKIYLKKTWKKLNKWAHPFGHWEKNVCPIFSNYRPTYHPTLMNESTNYLIAIIDLYISISIKLYKIDYSFMKDDFYYNKELFQFIITDKFLNK